MYLYIKAIHIIFVVTWFAALFYMPRLFVYDIESRKKDEPERSILTRQFGVMQKRLWYGISWPSMIITLILGSWLVIDGGWDITQGWMLYKLLFVIALVVYHIACHAIMIDLRRNVVKFSSTGMRIWNEIPTVFLFTVVFLVVLKNGLAIWYGLAGIAALIVALMAGIGIYKALRGKN
ncbi:MAG: CopD family protein [Flavobacteriales bacterium]